MMPNRERAFGRAPAEATRAFVEGLQRDLSCVAHAMVVRGVSREPYLSPQTIAVNSGTSVRLRVRGGATVRAFRATIQLVVEPERNDWVARAHAYKFAAEGESGDELFSYHWHPWTSVDFPHLHLEGGALGSGAAREILDAHFPTAEVPFAAFIALLIRDFGVAPIRSDWKQVLER